MNKTAIFFVLLAITFAKHIQISIDGRSDINPYILEDFINETIEGLRPDLPDPFNVDALEFSLPDSDDAIVDGDGKFSNFELTGLQDFELTQLNLAVIGMRLNFTLVLPSININSDYNLDLDLLHLIPLYGDGRANIHIEDLQVVGSAQADLTSGISVKNLLLQIYIGSTSFDIHGALDNEDFSAILNEILNDVVTSFVDNHQELITDIISPIVEDLINSIFSGGDAVTTVAP